MKRRREKDGRGRKEKEREEGRRAGWRVRGMNTDTKDLCGSYAPWCTYSLAHQAALYHQGSFEWETKEKCILNFWLTLKITKLKLEVFAFSQKTVLGRCNWCEKSQKNWVQSQRNGTFIICTSWYAMKTVAECLHITCSNLLNERS